MFLLIVFSLPLLTCLWWAIALRLLRGHRKLQVAVSAIMAATLIYIVLVIMARSSGVAMAIPGPVDLWNYTWYLFSVPLVVAPFSVVGVILLLQRWKGERRAKALSAENITRGESVDPPPAKEAAEILAKQPLTRRQVLQLGVATGPLIINGGAMMKAALEVDDFRVRHLDVPLPGLPDALDGFVIAHITDIHVGRFTHGKVLERIVEATNNINADLAVMTGDMIDSQLRDLPPGIEVMKAIRAKNGLYVVEGNHDLFESREEFERSLRDAGLNFLLNESVLVPLNGVKTAIMGMAWGIPGRSRHGAAMGENFTEVMAGKQDSAFSMLLSHHPDIFDEAAANNIPLTLAGHTHGGQLMLTNNLGVGPLMFKHWSGLYQSGGSALVVSNGVGNWMPLRINAPAEIIAMRLKKGAPAT
ncbi:metallophosphoesterase [Candidatus Sumerlaeota bacterium]|nr:metallophosphoesterase [Candidatus Sumerlaeota bacterium]